jgi:hypothetical protein
MSGGVNVLRTICMLELFSQRRVLHFRRRVTGECSSGQPIDLSNKILLMVDDVMRLICGFNLVDLYPPSKLIIRWLGASARVIGKCKRRIYRIIESIIRERATTTVAVEPLSHII